jgi:hypothetical protein
MLLPAIKMPEKWYTHLLLEAWDSSNGEPLPVLVSAFVIYIQEMMHVADNKGCREKLVQLVCMDQKGPSAKGVTLKETILTLVSEKKLHTRSKLYDVEPAELNTKNCGFYWAAMELVDQVLTQKQNDLLHPLNQASRKRSKTLMMS